MSKIIKLFLCSALLCLMFGNVVLAQDEPVLISETEDVSETIEVSEKILEAVSLDEEVSATDMESREPTILPDSPFYFLKDWGRRIRSFATFDPVAKAELESKFANEKLIELKKMVEENRDPEKIEKATENYEKVVEKVKAFTEKIEEKAGENEKVGKFLDKFTQHQVLHQKVLEKLEEKVSSETLEKIQEAREEHLEKFKDVMLKLENEENIPQRLEDNFEKIKGSQFKEFKALEILDDLKEKLPEKVKIRIEETKEIQLENLHKKLEELPSEEQERFKEYIYEIGGDKLKQLDIIGSLEGKELSDDLKVIIEEARERNIKTLEKKYEGEITQEKRSEEINKADESLESLKRLIVENNINKTEMPEIFRLVEKAETKLVSAKEYGEEEDSTRAFSQAIASNSLVTNAVNVIKVRAGFSEESAIENDVVFHCSEDIKSPVCGKDGKTYNNICEAKKAGREIAYRGECKTDLTPAQEGEKINRNPILGSTDKTCPEGLVEIRINESYSVCQKPDYAFDCQTDKDCPLSRCPGKISKCVNGKCIIPTCEDTTTSCIQVITPAKNPETGECKEFRSPCDVPENWIRVNSCENLEIRLRDSLEQERIESKHKQFQLKQIQPSQMQPLQIQKLESSQTQTDTEMK